MQATSAYKQSTLPTLNPAALPVCQAKSPSHAQQISGLADLVSVVSLSLPAEPSKLLGMTLKGEFQ